MKFRISVSDDQIQSLTDYLAAHDIETGDDAEYVITEAAKASAFLSVRTPERDSARLSPDEVVYIEAFGKDIEIHTPGETYFAQDRMYQLEALLDPKEFLRVSKSVIISRKHVKKIRPSLSMKYILTMSDGTLIDVTRSYYSDFRRFFNI